MNEAVCPTCRTRWRHNCDNTAAIVETGQTASKTVSACAASKVIAVKLTVTCVIKQGNRTYDALYGYSNPNAFPVTVPLGPLNQLTPPGYTSKVPPTVFAPGTKTSALFVSNIPYGVKLVWSLTVGGKTSTATAPQTTLPLCPKTG